jgi:hypothetical protein
MRRIKVRIIPSMSISTFPQHRGFSRLLNLQNTAYRYF